MSSRLCSPALMPVSDLTRSRSASKSSSLKENSRTLSSQASLLDVGARPPDDRASLLAIGAALPDDRAPPLGIGARGSRGPGLIPGQNSSTLPWFESGARSSPATPCGLPVSAASPPRTCASCCIRRSWNCRLSMQIAISRSSASRHCSRSSSDAPAAPASALPRSVRRRSSARAWCASVRIIRSSAAPIRSTGACDSCIACARRAAAVSRAATLLSLPRGMGPSERFRRRSAVLRLEHPHLLVELIGDRLQLRDRGVVLRLPLGLRDAILLRLEVEALEVGVHVLVVRLQRVHRREHLLLARGGAVGNLARRRRQGAVREGGKADHDTGREGHAELRSHHHSSTLGWSGRGGLGPPRRICMSAGCEPVSSTPWRPWREAGPD